MDTFKPYRFSEYCNGVYKEERCSHIQFCYGEHDWCTYFKKELIPKKDGSVLNIKLTECVLKSQQQ